MTSGSAGIDVKCLMTESCFSSCSPVGLFVSPDNFGCGGDGILQNTMPYNEVRGQISNHLVERVSGKGRTPPQPHMSC